MKLKSKALTSSEDFLANRKAHLEALGLVEEAVAAAAQGGGEAARDRQRERGKMPPRERVANLLDPGSPFLEVGATAAHDMYGGDAPCAGVIAGVGRVSGTECMVVCN
ncbi:MAG: carboxyl transferase domain-containing protein, partial [Roseovarius indicus]